MFGLAGLFVPQITYGLFTYAKFLDFLLMTEAGVIMSLAVLTFESAKQRLPMPAKLQPIQAYISLRNQLPAKGSLKSMSIRKPA
ncbi:MAG: hypothetical protein WD877_03070 [Candidatus Saccharimonadales bacterium]